MISPVSTLTIGASAAGRFESSNTKPARGVLGMTVKSPRPDLGLRPLGLGERHRLAAPVEYTLAALDSAIDGMLEVMRRAGYPALAGPLVGIGYRVIAIDLSRSGRSQIVLLNPEVETTSTERQLGREGCVALPGVTAVVDRPLWVVVRGLTRSGQEVRLHAGGVLGRMVQHQIDHLDGRTFVDRLDARQRRVVEARLRVRRPTCSLFDERLS